MISDGDFNFDPQRITIPEKARDWPLALMPRSTRLDNVLRGLGFTRLGDLHGLSFEDLIEVRNCGLGSIAELRSLMNRVRDGEFDEAFGAGNGLDLRALLDTLDRAIDKLPKRERKIVLWRFGATGQPVLTLEEIGAKYDLTRERVRQIANQSLTLILRNGAPAIHLALEKLAEKCLTAVCPLTPETLAHWLGKGAAKRRFMIPFYVHLCGALQPEIPAWPHGQKPEQMVSERTKEIVNCLARILSDTPAPPSLAAALDSLRKESPALSVQPSDLLEALKASPSLIVEFVPPDRPTVGLAPKAVKKAERTIKLATAILSESDYPLSCDEIIERARQKFGEDVRALAPRSMWSALRPERGFYLLDRCAFGLRRHFRLPESFWDQVRADFHGLLLAEERSISTNEVVNKRMFEWTGLTNAYEVALLLREDSRFVDLGRHLFALRDWGIEKREMIGDLIVRILKETVRPMSVGQLIRESRQFRSVATTATIRRYAKERPEVCKYGAGYYGLKSWGDKATEFLIAERPYISHFIAQLPPPISFKELCQYLKIPDTGHLADRLWETVTSLSGVCKYPGKTRAETMLRYRMWTLEHSLYALLSQFDRPLSVDEIQEILGSGFGLDEKRFAGRIKGCLRRSDLFARTRDGKFRLNE